MSALIPACLRNRVAVEKAKHHFGTHDQKLSNAWTWVILMTKNTHFDWQLLACEHNPGLSSTLNLSTCFRVEGTGSEILEVKERCRDCSTPRESSGNCRVCSYGTIIAGFDRCRLADGSIVLYPILYRLLSTERANTLVTNIDEVTEIS